MTQTTPRRGSPDPAVRPAFEFPLPDPPPSNFNLSVSDFAASRPGPAQAAEFGSAPPAQAPQAVTPGGAAVGAPVRRTAAPPPRVATAARGRPALSRRLQGLTGSFAWGRTFSLHRRLLAGDLRTLRETAEVESDTGPALAIMALGALVAALGAWLWLVFTGDGVSIGYAAARVLGLGLIISIAAWGAAIAATRWTMEHLFEARVELRRLIRPLALAAGIGVWQLFLFVPGISFAVGILGLIAWFLLSVVAVRAAAPELDDRGSVISVGIGFGVYVVLLTLAANMAGIAPGLFVHGAYR